MTTYGTTAKVIGFHKFISNDEDDTDINKICSDFICIDILVKTDLDIYLHLNLNSFGVYEHDHNTNDMEYVSYAHSFINYLDNSEFNKTNKCITRFPINELYIELNSIVSYCDELIHDLKCDIFEISRFGNKKENNSDNPRGFIKFNEDLFVDYDNEKRKHFMNSIKEELLAVALQPSRINELFQQGIKIGDFDKYI